MDGPSGKNACSPFFGSHKQWKEYQRVDKEEFQVPEMRSLPQGRKIAAKSIDAIEILRVPPKKAAGSLATVKPFNVNVEWIDEERTHKHQGNEKAQASRFDKCSCFSRAFGQKDRSSREDEKERHNPKKSEISKSRQNRASSRVRDNGRVIIENLAAMNQEHQ
jgi:hypothetical protein